MLATALLSLSIVLSLRPISHNTHKIARCHIVASESVQSLRDALNAAVEVEDYAEAQRLKERLGAKWWETLSSADKAQLLLKETAKAP